MLGTKSNPLKLEFDTVEKRYDDFVLGADGHASGAIGGPTPTKHVRCLTSKGRELVIPAALIGEALATPGAVMLAVHRSRTVAVDSGDYRVSVTHDTTAHVMLTRE